MDDGFRLYFLHHRFEFVVLGHIHGEAFDVEACQVLPDPYSFYQWSNRCEGLNTQFEIPFSANEVINDRYRMPLSGQVEGRSPTTVTIASKYAGLHFALLCSCLGLFLTKSA